MAVRVSGHGQGGGRSACLGAVASALAVAASLVLLPLPFVVLANYLFTTLTSRNWIQCHIHSTGHFSLSCLSFARRNL